MKPGRRRLWLRILAAFGLCAAGGLLLLAFAPLPVGWLVNRHGRDLPAVRLHVDSATLRLRPFGAGPTLDVRGLAVDQDGRPLARLARLDLFARKGELLDGRIAATIEAASLELTLPAADPEGKNADADATPPDPPALLAEMRSWLAADPRAVSVSVRDIRVSAPAGLLPSGVVAPDLARVDLVVGPRPEGELVARVEMHSADARGPAPVIEFVVAADNRSASASLDLPAVELGQMAALLTPGRPPETLGRLAARARADLDLVSLKPGAATLEIDGDELRLASPSPFSFPPAALRLRLRTNDAFDQIVAERFELTAPDLEVALPGLEVGVSPERDELRLRWGLRIAAAPARAWPDQWRERLSGLPPQMRKIVEELGDLRAEGEGRAILRETPSGWMPGELVIDHRLRAQLGPTPLDFTLTTDRHGTVALTMTKTNFAAGRDRADASPLAALDAPIKFQVGAWRPGRVGAPGPLGLGLGLSCGPGTLRATGPFARLGRDLTFESFELHADLSDLSHLRAGRAMLTAGGARVSLSEVSATLGDDDRVALEFRCDARVEKVAEWQAWLPPGLYGAFGSLGWPTDALELSLEASARAEFSPESPGGASFAAKGGAGLWSGYGRLGCEWELRRESAAEPIWVSVRMPNLRPYMWSGGPAPGFAWSDLRMFFDVSVAGELASGTFAPHLRLKLTGAGSGISVNNTNSEADFGPVEVPVRALSVEAAVAGDPLKIEVPELRVRLDEAVELSVTAARVDLHGNPKAEGRWAVSQLDLADALAAWPAKIESELRTRVAEHLKGGRVERLTGEFAVELPPGAAPKIGKANANLVLANVFAAGALLPVPVKLRRVEGTLRWPQVSARIEGMDVPGLDVSSADVALADMTASSWTVATRVAYVAELAALPAEWGVPKGVTGRATGDIAVDAKVRPEAGLPEELTFSGRVAVASLEVPGLVGGEATGRFGGGLSGDRGVKLEGVTDASRLNWRLPELADLRAPAELSVKAAAKLDAEWRPESANVAFSAPDVLGQAFALRLAGGWTKGPSAFPAKVELAELAWGRSRISGEFVETAQGPRVNLRSPLIVVPEIVTAARPRLASILQPGVSPPLENPQANGSTSSALASLVADVKIERIELGEDRVLRDIELAWSCGEDGLPRSASLSATEGAGNRLLATLETKPQERDRRLALRVDDVPRWAAAASAPLRVAPPSPTAKLGELEAVAGVMLGNLDTIVGLLAGGSLEASAVLPENQKPPRLQAVVAIRNATVLRAPRIVQMLALKSGRELQTRPLLREFSIQGLSLHDGLIEVAGVKLDGTGLIDKLRINKGSYALDGEVIAVDGTYFGIGFEVDGTRRAPQVWLKDNLLIRAVGNESNLDFGE